MWKREVERECVRVERVEGGRVMLCEEERWVEGGGEGER